MHDINKMESLLVFDQYRLQVDDAKLVGLFTTIIENDESKAASILSGTLSPDANESNTKEKIDINKTANLKLGNRTVGRITPLMMAIARGCVKITIELIAMGANVNQKEEMNGQNRTALSFCIAHNQVDILKILSGRSEIPRTDWDFALQGAIILQHSECEKVIRAVLSKPEQVIPAPEAAAAPVAAATSRANRTPAELDGFEGAFASALRNRHRARKTTSTMPAPAPVAAASGENATDSAAAISNLGPSPVADRRPSFWERICCTRRRSSAVRR